MIKTGTIENQLSINIFKVDHVDRDAKLIRKKSTNKLLVKELDHYEKLVWIKKKSFAIKAWLRLVARIMDMNKDWKFRAEFFAANGRFLLSSFRWEFLTDHNNMKCWAGKSLG